MLNSHRYRIIKILNNNVILAFDLSNKQECILVGKGLGFGKKINSIINSNTSNIEKSFITYDKEIKNEYLKLIKQLNIEVLGVGEEIIALAEERLGTLNPHIHISLTDHIGFSIERLKEGLEINNPFINEIKILYKEEYQIGTEGSKIIKEHIGIDIPEAEIGFIALHIHSARQNKKVKETVKNTRLINDLVGFIENELSVKLDPTDLCYIRLINHIRFVIERIKNNRTIQNPIIDGIKKEFKKSFSLAEELALMMKKSMDIDIPEDEISYLAIHIQRLKNNVENQKQI